jgi:hypothetical protein
MAMAADLGNFVLSFMSDCNTEIIIFICKHKHVFCLTLSPGTEGLTNLTCINVYVYCITCMVGKVEAPEKANMMDPKAVKNIFIKSGELRSSLLCTVIFREL